MHTTGKRKSASEAVCEGAANPDRGSSTDGAKRAQIEAGGTLPNQDRSNCMNANMKSGTSVSAIEKYFGMNRNVLASWALITQHIPSHIRLEVNKDFFSTQWQKHRDKVFRPSHAREDSRLLLEEEIKLIMKYYQMLSLTFNHIILLCLAGITGRPHKYICYLWHSKTSVRKTIPRYIPKENFWAEYESLVKSMPPSIMTLLPGRDALSQMKPEERLGCLENVSTSIANSLLLTRKPEEPETMSEDVNSPGAEPSKEIYHGPLIKDKIYTITPDKLITLVNQIDTEGLPLFFEYVYDWDLSCVKDVPTFRDGDWLNFKADCECEGDCTFGSRCSHVDFKGCPYDSNGRLMLEKIRRNLLSECSNKCSCGPDCGNRIVQSGAKVELQIYKTEMKGWGVKAMEPISKGTYVGEYIGELILQTEGNSRKHNEYLFDVDAARPWHKYSIDAEKKGNVARFFNHSCNPNLQIFNVLTETLNHELHRLAYFALRDISEGEELTFDYRYETDLDENPCYCGAPNCRRFFK